MGRTSFTKQCSTSLNITRGGCVHSAQSSSSASPYILLNIPDSFNDSDFIGLADYINTNISELSYDFEVVEEEYGTLDAEFDGSQFVINSHFDGKVKIIISAANNPSIKREKVITLICNDEVDPVCSVENIVTNEGNNAEYTDENITIAFDGVTTPMYASGRSGTPVVSRERHNVTIARNTSSENVTRSGSFVWNGCTIMWQVIQHGTPSITLNLESGYEDNTTINLIELTTSNVNIGYSVDVENTDYGAFSGGIVNGVLNTGGHFDGTLKVTAYYVNNTSIREEQYIYVVCNDELEPTYSISDVKVNNDESVDATATEADITFKGTTTKRYASGRVGLPTTNDVAAKVYFPANESEEPVTRSGIYTWNGIEIDWSVTQSAASAQISADTISLLNYYGVERTDEEVAAVDTFLKDLKAHSAYDKIHSLILPILAPKSDRTVIEEKIASNTELNTSANTEIVKASYDIINGVELNTTNTRNWFIGKNGLRSYKTNTSRKYLAFPSITLNNAVISGGAVVNSNANQSNLKIINVALRSDNSLCYYDGSSKSTQTTLDMNDKTNPFCWAVSRNINSIYCASNGVAGSPRSGTTIPDGSDTNITTDRLLRIDATTTSNGLSASFDDENAIVVAAAWWCNGYTMTQEELNSITAIFKRLMDVLWKV